jgi:hypothetical protein
MSSTNDPGNDPLPTPQDLQLELLYEQAMDEFQEEKDLALIRQPDYTVDPSIDGYKIDHDSYTLAIAPESILQDCPDDIKDSIKDEIGKMYNKVIEIVAAEEKDKLLERYHPFDATISYRSISFDADISDDSAGSYSPEHRHIKINEKYMQYIDPFHQRIDGKEDKLRGIIRHEIAHNLTYVNNKNAFTLRNHVRNDTDSYKEDIRRGFLEAITKFEQYNERDVATYNRIDQAIEDLWDLPQEMEHYPELDGERDKGTMRDPYRLGYVTAYAVKTAFQDRHSSQEDLEMTREYFLHCITTPKGMRGTIEQSFELRDVPNYPHLLSEHYRLMDDMESDPAAELTGVFEEIEAELRQATSREEALENYLRASAVLSSLREITGDLTGPAEELKEAAEETRSTWR